MDNRNIALNLTLDTTQFRKEFDALMRSIKKDLVISVKVDESSSPSSKKKGKGNPDLEPSGAVIKPKPQSPSGGSSAEQTVSKAQLKADLDANKRLEYISKLNEKQIDAQSKTALQNLQASKGLADAVKSTDATSLTGAFQQNISKSIAQPYTKLLSSSSRELNTKISDSLRKGLSYVNKEISFEISQLIKSENKGLETRNSDAFLSGLSQGFDQVFNTITEKWQSAFTGEVTINQRQSKKKGVEGTVENLATNQKTFQLLKNESAVIDAEIYKLKESQLKAYETKSFASQTKQLEAIEVAFNKIDEKIAELENARVLNTDTSESGIAEDARLERQLTQYYKQQATLKDKQKTIKSTGAYGKIEGIGSEIKEQEERQAFYIQQAQKISANIKELTAELDNANYADLVKVSNKKKAELAQAKQVSSQEKGKLEVTDEMVIRDKTPALVDRLAVTVSNLTEARDNAIKKAKKLDAKAKLLENVKLDESDPWVSLEEQSNVASDALAEAQSKALEAKKAAVTINSKLKKANDALKSAKEVQAQYANVQDTTSREYEQSVRLENQILSEAVASLEAKGKMSKRIPQAYRQILQLTPKLKSINPEKLPKLDVGLKDAYDAATSNLLITQKTLAGLGKNLDSSSLDSIANITRAMAKGYQSGFNGDKEQDIQAGIANPKFVTTLKTKNKAEAKKIAAIMRNYANLEGVEYQRQLDIELATLRAVENARTRKAGITKAAFSQDVRSQGVQSLEEVSKFTEASPELMDKADSLFSSLVDLGEIADLARVGLQENPGKYVDELSKQLQGVLDAHSGMVSDLKSQANYQVDLKARRALNSKLRKEERLEGGKNKNQQSSGLVDHYRSVNAELAPPTIKEKAASLSIAASKKLGQAALTTIRGAQATYGAAKALESVALDLTGLAPVAGMAKTIAPYAATGLAAGFLPGAGAALDVVGAGVHALLPAVEGLTTALGGVSGAIVEGLATTATGSIAGMLPFGGGAATAAGVEVAGLLGASTAAAVSGAAGLGVSIGAAVAPTVIATKAMTKALNAGADKLEEMVGGTDLVNKSQKTVSKKLTAGADAVSNTMRYLQDAKDRYIQITEEPYAGKSKALAGKAFKALPATTQVRKLEEQGNKLAALLPGLDAGLASGSEEEKSFARQVKATVAKRIKTINREIAIASKKIKEVPTQFATPSLKQRKEQNSRPVFDPQAAKQVKTEVLGGDFVDGYEGGIGKGMKRVHAVAFDLAEEAVEGLRKGQDSASPAKETFKKGIDFVAGYAKSIFAGGKTAFNTAKGLSKAAVKGLGEVAKDPKGTLSYYLLAGMEQAKFKAKQFAASLKPSRGKDYQDNLVNNFDTNLEDYQIRIDSAIDEQPVKFLDRLKDRFEGLETVISKVLGKDVPNKTKVVSKAFAGMLPLAGVFLFRNQIKSAVTDLVRFNLEIEATSQKLKTVGVNVNSGNLFKTFAKDASAAGQSVTTYANTLAALKASTKGKIGNAEGLTKDISLGLAKRGVTGESAERALGGIQQIASKGVVSMEELRQQISEALPGAMSIAAQSMGMTERQFNSMVSSGQIMSSEFLPKFAKALNAASGDSNKLATQLVTLQNSWGQFKEGIVNVEVFKKSLGIVNVLMKALASLAPAVGLAITSVLVSSFVLGAKSIVSMVAASKALQTTLLSIGKISGVVGLSIAAITGAYAVFNTITNKSSENIRKLADELGKLNKEQGKTPITWADRFKVGSSNRQRLDKKNLGEENYNLGVQYKGGNFLERMDVGLSARAANKAFEGIKKSIAAYDALSKSEFEVDNADLASFAAKNDAKLKQAAALRYKANNIDAFVKPGENSTTLAEQYQLEAEKLTQEVELEAEVKFKLSDRQQKIAELEAQLENTLNEVELGNSKVENERLAKQLELRIKQAKDDFAKISQSTSVEKVSFDALNKAQSKTSSIGSKVSAFTNKQEIDAYRQLLAEGASARVAEVRMRKLGIEAKREELRLTQEAIAAQKQAIESSLTPEKLQQLEGALGTSVANADTEAVENARKAFEALEATGAKIDPMLQKALESTASNVESQAKVNDLNKELVKEQFDLQQAVKDLKYEIKGLQLEAASKAIEFRAFGLEASRYKADKVNPLKFQAEDNTRQLEQSIRSQNLAYTQAIEGLQDFNYGIQNATKDLAMKMVNVARDMQVAAINGISSYLGAANIQDMLGIGKFRDLVTEAVGITQSDNRPTLTREKQELERSFQIEQRNQKRQQEQLNVDTQSQIADNNRRVTEQRIAKERALQDDALDIERLKIRRAELEKSKEETNRNIKAANDAAKEYGVAERASLVVETIPEINEADLESTKAEMAKYYDTVINGTLKANQLLANIASKGNAELNKQMAEGNRLQKERVALKDAEIAQDGERIKQANEILVQKIQGTSKGVINQLGKDALNLKTNLQSVKDAVNELLGSAGLGLNYQEQLNAVGNKKLNEVETKIAELRASAQELKDFNLETNYNEAGLAGLNNIVANSDIAPEVKAAIAAEAATISQSGNYQEMQELILTALEAYESGANKLDGNKQEIAQAAVDQFSNKYNRRQQDVLIDKTQLELDGNYKLDSDQKTLAQAEIDYTKEKLRIQRELQDLIASGEDVAKVKEYGASLSQINSMKLEKIRYELKMTTQMAMMAKQPLMDAFMGIGQNLGKALTNAVDPTAFQEKTNEINAQFGQDLLEIQEKYADDPAKLEEATDRLKALNETKLDGIKNEFSLLGGIIDSLKNALASFAQTLTQTLMQKGVDKLVGSILGGAFGGGGGGAIGSVVGGLFANGGEVGTYAKGGMVGCYPDGGSVLGKKGFNFDVLKAMKKERSLSGKKPVPIVVHEGEQILSTLNGDAQLFRKLQTSGEWDKIKSGNSIGTFAYGGAVGNSNPYSSFQGSSNNQAPQWNKNLSVTNNWNIKATDANSFNRSKPQIEARTNARLSEAQARNS